jgi:uncharacterized OsmC-like protein
MSVTTIRDSIVNVEEHYKTNPEPGPKTDTPATAIIENGLKCRITSPDGRSIYTDMPEAVGGSNTANSPGWTSRAAIASCDATLLAMRAARVGINLNSIEVRVEAASDGRGMFLDEGISPGSTQTNIFFEIGANDSSREQIQELVDWVVEHSPVGTDLGEPVNVVIDLEIV